MYFEKVCSFEKGDSDNLAFVLLHVENVANIDLASYTNSLENYLNVLLCWPEMTSSATSDSPQMAYNFVILGIVLELKSDTRADTKV